MGRTYLDHNATTPLGPAAREAWLAAAAEAFGNASSAHWAGVAPRRLVDAAREEVAALVGAAPSEVVFTSGGTEADVTAVQAMAWAARARRPGRTPHLVAGSTEHQAVLQAHHALEARGLARVTLLPVDGEGRVDPGALEAALADADGLSLMAANNETGVRVDAEAVAARVEAAGVPWLLDAVQVPGRAPLDLRDGPWRAVTYAALSAHKLHGPKGAGALVVRRGAPFSPLLAGEGQERGRRAGTSDAPGLAAFAAAAGEARAGLAGGGPARMAALRDRLERGLAARLPGSRVHGAGAPRLPNTSSVALRGADGRWLDAEELALDLSLAGFAVATGAACASGSGDPSHVLLAMACDAEEAQATVRVSLGRDTSEAEIDAFVEAVAGLAGA